MYEDMMRSGLNRNSPDLVRTLTEHAKEAFDWTVSSLGVEYLDRVDIFGGHSVPRCYTAKNITGATIIKKQIEKLRELCVPVRFKTKVENFILDSEGGVAGVCVHPLHGVSNELKLKATKGVIIASGGFAADVPFRLSYDSRLTADVSTTNKSVATSEVLCAAVEIGAATQDLDCIQSGPWASPDESGYGVGPQFSEYIVFQYGLIIDPTTGKRFVNELSDRKILSDALFEVGHPCIGLADSQAVEISGWNIDAAIKRGVVRKFDTLDEVATFYHINTEQLKNTITSFNANFKAGKDLEFAKPLLKDAEIIQKPPYFTIKLWPKVHFTMGGLIINSNAEVVDIQNAPIPRLYAAGEVTGGIHGASRLGSCSITDCIVFGRIAGQKAARNTP